MSNAQVRLIASAIALLAGGIIANTSNIDVNVSIFIILISSIIFIVEYWRLQTPQHWAQADSAETALSPPIHLTFTQIVTFSTSCNIVRTRFILFLSSAPGHPYLSHFSLDFVAYCYPFAKKLGSISGNLLTFGRSKECNDNCHGEYTTKITKMESSANWSHFSPFCDQIPRSCDP